MDEYQRRPKSALDHLEPQLGNGTRRPTSRPHRGRGWNLKRGDKIRFLGWSSSAIRGVGIRPFSGQEGWWTTLSVVPVTIGRRSADMPLCSI